MADVDEISTLAKNYGISEEELRSSAKGVFLLNYTSMWHRSDTEIPHRKVDMSGDIPIEAVYDAILVDCNKKGYDTPKFFYATTNLCATEWGVKEPHIAPEDGDLEEIKAYLAKQAFKVRLLETKYAKEFCLDIGNATDPSKEVLKGIFKSIRETSSGKVDMFATTYKGKPLGIQDIGVQFPKTGSFSVNEDLADIFIKTSAFDFDRLVEICNDDAVRWLL